MPAPFGPRSGSRPLCAIALACAIAGALAPEPARAHGLAPRAAPTAPLAAERAAAPPEPWCGSRRTADDRRHAAFGAAPTIKVVYAHPAGRPDRLRHFAPVLQATAAAVARYVADASGRRKTVRFDLGTRCGPRLLDVQSVRLRHRAAFYRGDDGLPAVDAGTPLRAELRRATRATRHRQKFLVYADGLHPAPPGSLDVSGQTDDLPQDSRPGRRNAANRGGSLAVVFGPGGAVPPATRDGFATAMFAHELLHALGAVQRDAPHATAGGHCYDGADVLCYRDRTALSALYTERDCPAAPMPPLDCGGDDYFNPVPPPGSYLARHWNVYDSAYLVACADPRAAPACAQEAAAQPAAEHPRISARRPILLAAGGRPLGDAVVDLELTSSVVVAHASSSPVALPRGRHRVETCLAVGGGRQSSPWRDCVSEQLDGSPGRAPETSVQLAAATAAGAEVAVEVRVTAADGTLVAASQPATIAVPRLDATPSG
jgi:hypothetical protein